MKNILKSLFENHHLSRQDAMDALILIAGGNLNDVQVASFMTVFLIRKITVEELGGFRDALLELGQHVDLSEMVMNENLWLRNYFICRRNKTCLKQ